MKLFSPSALRIPGSNEFAVDFAGADNAWEVRFDRLYRVLWALEVDRVGFNKS